jgi:Tfp pilus assembly protein PilO
MSRIYLSIFFLVAALATGMLLAMPKFQSMNTIQGEVERAEIQLASKTDYFNHIKKLFASLENYEEPLSKVDTALPDNPLLPSTFNLIQEAASQSGLIVEQVSASDIPQELAKSKDKKEMKITLSLMGSYPSFKQFLVEIEKSSRLFKAETISFGAPEDGEFTFSAEFIIYYY